MKEDNEISAKDGFIICLIACTVFAVACFAYTKNKVMDEKKQTISCELEKQSVKLDLMYCERMKAE